MTKKRSENYIKGAATAQKNSLQIEDLARYLTELAKLHGNPRTGNSELSEGLKIVAKALKPFSKRLICEMTDTLSNHFLRNKAKDIQKQPKVELPPNIDSLTADKINEILNNTGYTKLQIIDLGVQRFSISRSKLMRQNKGEVTESIQAALNHESSLGVISQKARSSGTKRTS